MGKEFKTIQEINALIPQLESIMSNLRALKREIREKNAAIQEKKMSLAKKHKLHKDSFFAEEAEIEFLLMNANGLVQQIEQMGGELKDIDNGLVDFYGIVKGERVYLCWRSGESELGWYHHFDEGFRGRKPLE